MEQTTMEIPVIVITKRSRKICKKRRLAKQQRIAAEQQRLARPSVPSFLIRPTQKRIDLRTAVLKRNYITNKLACYKEQEERRIKQIEIESQRLEKKLKEMDKERRWRLQMLKKYHVGVYMEQHEENKKLAELKRGSRRCKRKLSFDDPDGRPAKVFKESVESSEVICMKLCIKCKKMKQV